MKCQQTLSIIQETMIAKNYTIYLLFNQITLSQFHLEFSHFSLIRSP